MSRAFNLTAEINLRGPSNIRTVVADIRRQIGTINVNINPQISPAASRNIGRLNTDLQRLNRAFSATRIAANDASAAIRNFGQALNGVASNNIQQNFNNAVNACQNLGRAAGGAGGDIGGAATQMEEFGRQSALAIRRFAAFSVVTTGIYAFTNAISKGVSAFIDFDKEFVRLQQVTGESAKGLQSLSSEITRLSTGLGIASKDLTTVAVTLAQAGLSATDTKKALEALALSALAPSFDDMNETVEGSIALMRQFGIGAGDLEGALGSINSVAAKFAVEASDIITAIQRTGGVFATASKGVSEGTDALNEFVAIFTSVRQTTRESAETIATGLRTIFTRIQRGGTIQALKEYGVELTDLEGKFVGPFEAVKRLSEGLNQLDPRDIRFSSIVEELGGFRQIGKVIPLIQQFAVAQQALKVAQTGQASLAEDAATAQLSVANQIAKVREEFTALIRSIGESDSFRSFVTLSLQLTSALIKLADAAKIVLPALTAIAAVRGASAAYQFGAGFSGALGGGRGGRGGRRFASGGLVPGSGNGDTVPAMLTPGEFVIRKKAVEKLGAGNLHNINRYADGGRIIDSLKTNKSVGAAILEQGQYQSKSFNIPRKVLEKSVGFKIDKTKIPDLRNIKAISEGLSPDSFNSFDKNLNKGIILGIDHAASSISQDLGISYQGISSDNQQSFLNGINSGTRGNIFEDVLLALKQSPGPFAEREAGQPFDFPGGLSGVLKDDYKNLPPEWIDAKASFKAASMSRPGNLKSKTIRQLSNEIIAQKSFFEDLSKKSIAPASTKTKKIGLQDAIARFQGKSITDESVASRLKEMALTTYSDKQDIDKFLKTGKVPNRGAAQTTVLQFLGQRLKRANGGDINGKDSVPALLTPGEFVINKKAASRLGEATLHNLNRADKVQGYNTGGLVQRFARGGTPSGAGWTGRGVTPLSNYGVPGNQGNMLGGIGSFVAITAGGAAIDSIGDAIGNKAGAAIKSIGGDALNFGAIGAQIGMMLTPILGPFGPIFGGLAGGAIGLGKALLGLSDTFNKVDQEIKFKQLESQSEKTANSIDKFGKSLSIADRTAAGKDFVKLAQNEAELYNLKVSSQEITSSSKPSEIMKTQEAGAVAASKFLETEMKRTGSTFEELQASMDPGLFNLLSQQIAEGSIEYATAVINRKKQIEQAGGDPTKIAKAEEDYKKTTESITKNSIRLLGISYQSTIRQQKVNQQIEDTVDIYSRINASLIRFNSDIDIMRDSALQTVRDLDGSSTIAKSQRVGENVLGNMSAYSSAEVSNAADLVSRAVGGEVGKNLSENVKASKFVSDKLPGILRATAQGENADIFGAITKQAETEKIKLPEFLLKDIQETLNEFQSGTGEAKNKSISDLANDPELLSKLSKVLEVSSETAAKALKTYYDSLDKVTELQNEYIKTIGVANEYQRKASEIQLNSALDLKKIRGQEISLAEMNQPFETNIRALTGGVTDPTQIANIIKSSQEEATRLETQRNEAINKGDTEAIKKNDQALINNRLRLNNATNALKQLADNSSRASNALSKIQEKAARNEATVGTIENILTAGPEELLKMTDQFKAVAAGAQAGPEFFAGPQGFRNREMAFGGLNLIKDLIPNEQYRALRGQFIEQSLKGLGLDNNPFFKKIMEDFKAGGVPEEDPTVKEYKRLVNEQQQSNVELQNIYEGAANKLLTTSETIFTKLNTDLPTIIKTAYETARKEIRASVEAANPPEPERKVEPARVFQVESPTLSEIQTQQPFATRVFGIPDDRPFIPPSTKMGATGKQHGGIIYASKGQLINFKPKGTDTVPAMLTPGEFVVNARSTKSHRGLLEQINSGKQLYASNGGVVYAAEGGQITPEERLAKINQDRSRKGLAPRTQQDVENEKSFANKMAESGMTGVYTDLQGNQNFIFPKDTTTEKQNKIKNNANIDPVATRKAADDAKVDAIADPLLQERVRKQLKMARSANVDSAGTLDKILESEKLDTMIRETQFKEKRRELKEELLNQNSAIIGQAVKEVGSGAINAAAGVGEVAIGAIRGGVGLASAGVGAALARTGSSFGQGLYEAGSDEARRGAANIMGGAARYGEAVIDPNLSEPIYKPVREQQNQIAQAITEKRLQQSEEVLPKGSSPEPFLIEGGRVFTGTMDLFSENLVNAALSEAAISSIAAPVGRLAKAIDQAEIDQITRAQASAGAKRLAAQPAPVINAPLKDSPETLAAIQRYQDRKVARLLRTNKMSKQSKAVTTPKPVSALPKQTKNFSEPLEFIPDKEVRQALRQVTPVAGRSPRSDAMMKKTIAEAMRAKKARKKKPRRAAAKSTGGIIYAQNGMMIPLQKRNTDTIPAMLSKGEFVVNRNATANNLPLLQSLNKGGMVKYYQNGGRVGGADNAQASNTSLSTINLSDNAQSALSTFTSNFGSYVDSLVNFSFPTIPDKIEMVGSHTVDVRVTGAAAFESLQEGIKKLIDNSINQKMGEMWNQTGGQIGKAPSLPSKK